MSPVEILYAIFSVLITVLLGMAWPMMGPAPADFQRARACFWGASFLAFGMIVMWGATVGDGTSTWGRLLLVSVIGAIITVATDETLRFVTVRQTAAALPPAITTTRQAYSAEAAINSLPPLLNGRNTINVDNVISLRLSVPYSANEVTLTVNAAGVHLPDKNTAQMQVSGTYVTTGSVQRITLNRTDKKTQIIKESGRTFSIRLVDSRVLNTPGVANPLEWNFAISEQ